MIDYATKYCLAVTIGPTSRAQDAVACLHAAIAETERVTGLDDLCDGRGLMDIVDPDEYVLGQVPDRSPSSPTTAPASAAASTPRCSGGEDPLRRHVRTGVRSPQTNDVVERFFGSLKCEHLYRADIVSA